MKITALSFDDWLTRLQELAFEAEHNLGDPESYQEYFDDGDTPEQTLAEELSRLDDEPGDWEEADHVH